MLKKHKWNVIISSILVLIPILIGLVLWNDLPDMMTTHWGADGNADGFSAKSFAVFGLPAILLVLHLACLFFTSLDKKQKDQNDKVLGMVFWIVPFISLLTNGIVYSTAFGQEFHIERFMPIFIGLMFIFIGNYLPKTKQNRTIGIKIPWTLNNEENWNKTHRFGGKVWVIGGLISLLSALLPIKLMVFATVGVIIAMIAIPFIYSYCIYKKHQKEGVVYTSTSRGKAETTIARISAIVVPILLIGVAVVMFTGNINIHFGATSFKIEATYWNDLEVDYSKIDSIEYREDVDAGIRTYGFGSARLSMGTFQNEEFGTYTRYAYNGNDNCVVLKVDEKCLVINGKNPSDTKEIYEVALAKMQ